MSEMTRVLLFCIVFIVVSPFIIKLILAVTIPWVKLALILLFVTVWLVIAVYEAER